MVTEFLQVREFTSSQAAITDINPFSGFNPATDPAAVESDVDIETYSTELKRLLAASTIATSTSAEKEEIEIQIRLNRSIIDELERARSILEEGEY